MSQILRINRSEGFGYLDNPSIAKNWPWLKGWVWGEQDQRSIILFEVDIEKIKLLGVTRDGEASIGGIDRFNRIRLSAQIPLDAALFQMFWKNKHLIPEGWKKSGTIITFDGTIFYNSLGISAFLAMWWCGIENKWFCELRCVDRFFTSKYLSATISQN